MKMPILALTVLAAVIAHGQDVSSSDPTVQALAKWGSVWQVDAAEIDEAMRNGTQLQKKPTGGGHFRTLTGDERVKVQNTFNARKRTRCGAVKSEAASAVAAALSLHYSLVSQSKVAPSIPVAALFSRLRSGTYPCYDLSAAADALSKETR